MTDITVYTKPGCGPCEFVKRQLERSGIQHSVVDVTRDDEAMARVKSLGYGGVPVVVAGDRHWQGADPANMAWLISEVSPCEK